MILDSRSSDSATARRRALFLAVFLPALLLSALSACSGNKKPEIQPLPLTEAGVFEPMSPGDIQLYQPHVRLAASYSFGELWVTIQNTTDRPIGVSYQNFALLANKKRYPITPATAGILFPQSVLQPGEMASGRFQMRNQTNLVGLHCVFMHPDVKPSRCVIRAGKIQAPVPPTEEDAKGSKDTEDTKGGEDTKGDKEGQDTKEQPGQQQTVNAPGR